MPAQGGPPHGPLLPTAIRPNAKKRLPPFPRYAATPVQPRFRSLRAVFSLLVGRVPVGEVLKRSKTRCDKTMGYARTRRAVGF
jgi:hypothetical protein